MNAPHEEAAEFAKVSKRENRVYVGNLSYDVKYRDLMEFMRGGGLGNLGLSAFRLCVLLGVMVWGAHAQAVGDVAVVRSEDEDRDEVVGPGRTGKGGHATRSALEPRYIGSWQRSWVWARAWAWAAGPSGASRGSWSEADTAAQSPTSSPEFGGGFGLLME